MNRTALGIVGAIILIAALYLIFGRPTDSSNPTPSVPTETTDSIVPATTAIVELTLDYRKDGSIKPPTHRIEQGKKVKLTVTSEINDEVHLHGYDLSAKVAPGTPAIIEFAADKTGRFEAELEQGGQTLGVIEVYPGA